MQWARALRRFSGAVLIACALAAGAAYAARSAYPLPLPANAERIIESDWCSKSSYSDAEAVKGVSRAARKSLEEAKKVALAHPVGCQTAERFAHREREAKFPSGKCPKNPAPLMPGGSSAAGGAAAGFEGRRLRPVIIGYGARMAQVRHACGKAIARRTITVGLTLTAYLPSASLSERVVAVEHLQGGGWRVWMVLH
jgi:hypothetical protein